MCREQREPIRSKDVPSITVWLPRPELATGSAVVVCPGGGYGMLAVEHEGKQVAEWLNSLGVAAFVLKYRLGPRYHHPAMLDDAGRAIRTVRANAAKWKVDPGRVAIMGFSAGGHLASTAGTHFSCGQARCRRPRRTPELAARPDDPRLPGHRTGHAFGHTGSLRNLLGENPSQELIESLSNERQVTKDTPPTFLAHTNADTRRSRREQHSLCNGAAKSGCSGRASPLRARPAWARPRLGSAQFNIPPEPSFQVWPKLCETWLKNQGFLNKK